MGKYALIKDGIIANIVIAEASFIDAIRGEWDAIIDYEEHPQNPSPYAAAEIVDDQWVFTNTLDVVPVLESEGVTNVESP